jgi:demethylmenaquinone methyltransferase/2-methoxy-6-polyprenyl-1,4-benzoquinol methylase
MEDWRSYDLVAENYERVHAPRFREVARDLIELAEPAPEARALDVGTGTGVAAEVLAERSISVVGADPSMGMLAVGHRVRPLLPLVAAEAIDLPFRDGRFDLVTANFVLAHFVKVETALYDMHRVLRPGGTIAVSSWSDGPDAFQEAFRGEVERVIPRELLEPAYAEAAPGHERFRDRENVEEALIDAGFRRVRTEVASYRWAYGVDEYLDGLEVWATGRFVRGMLGEAGWASFRTRVRDAFAQRFADPLNDFRDVILAVGTREA